MGDRPDGSHQPSAAARCTAGARHPGQRPAASLHLRSLRARHQTRRDGGHGSVRTRTNVFKAMQGHELGRPCTSGCSSDRSRVADHVASSAISLSLSAGPRSSMRAMRRGVAVEAARRRGRCRSRRAAPATASRCPRPPTAGGCRDTRSRWPRTSLRPSACRRRRPPGCAAASVRASSRPCAQASASPSMFSFSISSCRNRPSADARAAPRHVGALDDDVLERVEAAGLLRDSRRPPTRAPARRRPSRAS